MKNIAWNKSLSFKIFIWFLLISIVPLIVLSYINYNSTHKSLNLAAELDIKHTSLIKKRFIENWFSYRQTDISSWSQSKISINFLSELSNLHKQKKNDKKKYIQSYKYVKIATVYENEFLRLSREYNYIYDIYLIDKQGNILYTIAKENDLGTNLLNGKLSNTKFATALRKTFKTGEIHFSDLESYEPSNNIKTSFLTAPIIDENGNMIGSFAVQLKLDQVINTFKEFQDLRFGYKHYLIGEDRLLRNTIDKNRTALDFKINSQQTLLWKKTNNTSSKQNNEGFVVTYDGPFGYKVIGLHHNINILGVDWALISEVKEDLILQNINQEFKTTIILFLITILFVIMVSIYMSNLISSPIRKLSEANLKFSQGKRDVFLKNNYQGELKLLVESFNNMTKSLNDSEDKLMHQTKQAKRALEELDEQKQALDAHSIVAITNVKGIITFVNDKFVDISGYCKDELIGKNHNILNSGAHSTEFWEEMYHTVSHGNIWNADVCNISKDMSYYWVNTTIVPLMKNGKPKNYIAIRTDITQNKNQELELTKAKEVAENSLKTKSEFLASMSHEIRTPMNGVVGMLDLLSNTDLSSAQFQQLYLAQSSAKSLLIIINDILDFSKIEAGKLEIEEVRFNIVSELGNFTKALAIKANEKEIQLLLDTNEIEKKYILADSGRIRQILTNIVGNSIKFTSKGYVLIKVTMDCYDENNAILKIKIQDTGIGIPEDKVDSLFDKFTQVDTSTTRKYGGTGLGLAIVKQLVQLMDGEVSVESKEGEGSTFIVDIHVKTDINQPSNNLNKELGKKRILLLDDSELNHEILLKEFKKADIRIFNIFDTQSVFLNCDRLIKKGQIPPYDMIIFDKKTIGNEVKEFYETIVNNNDFNDVKLIELSSIQRIEDLNNMSRVSSLSKPIIYEDITHIYDIMLNKERNITKTLSINKHNYDHINVLVVDDNETNQAVAEGLLNAIGFKCDIARDGQRAIDILKNSKKKYDIIFMDCQMPILDGYEATALIKDGHCNTFYKTIPIIAMTANAMQGDKEKCINAGMDDYISKPIDTKKLKDILYSYFLDGYESEIKDEDEVKYEENNKENSFSIWDIDEATKRFGGSKETLNKILKIFLNDIKPLVNNLKCAIESKDMESCKLHSHSIKGASANVSANKLQNIAKLVEDASKENNVKLVHTNNNLLQNYAKELTAVIEEYLLNNNIETNKIELTKQEMLDNLNKLKYDLQNGAFIDIESFDIFKVDMEKLNILKNEIDQFNIQKSIDIIDEIINIKEL